MPVTYEALRDRVKAWTAPIPGASPAGASAKFDPDYQLVANEVGKLDTPAGGAVNWKAALEKSGVLLGGKSKDLVIAAYLAHGLHVTGGIPGLTTGCVLLVEFLEQYWDTMFPDAKRLRGRANAVQWFVEKTQLALARPPEKATPEEVEALEVAAVRLADRSREKLAEMAPAFGAILEAVARLKAELAPPPPPPEPEAPPPEAPAAGAAPAAAPSAPSFAAGEDVAGFLSSAGSAMVQAAAALRQADPTDPLAYRLLRAGSWLPCTTEPVSDGGKTLIPPPGWRAHLQEQAAGADREAWREAAEGASADSPLWLDAQRHAWQALDALGERYAAARDAVAGELRALLGRLPGLPRLAFDDGSPLADPETQAWLGKVVGAAPAGGAGDGPGAEAAERLARARQLLEAGDVAAALAATRAGAAAAAGERERFLVRLEVGRILAAAGLQALAQATFAELDREAQARGLDAWEPSLAAACLRGLIASGRALADDPRGVSLDLVVSYRRLCRLDPASAHEVWP